MSATSETFADLVAEQIRALCAPPHGSPFGPGDVEPNDWAGVDYVDLDGNAVARVCPIDGEWAVGWDAYLFSHNAVVTASATFRASGYSARAVAASIAALAQLED